MVVPELTTTPLAGAAEAPVLLVLPSLGGTVGDWRAAAALLGQRFRVIGVELPGHGAAAPATGAFSIADLAEAVFRVAASLDAGPVALAGVSFGGAVVQELALRAGAVLGPLAVVCSAPRMGTPESWSDRAAAVRAEGTGSLTEGLADRWFSPAFRASEPAEVERVLRGVAAVDDESYALCCEALGGWDRRDAVARLAVPVLVVRGAEDPVADEAAMRPLLAADAVRTVVVPGVRHQAAIERPDAVAEALLTL